MTENQKFAGGALAMIGGTALLIAFAALLGNAGTASQRTAGVSFSTFGESLPASDKGYRIVENEDVSTHIPHLRLKVFRASGGMESRRSSLC